MKKQYEYITKSSAIKAIGRAETTEPSASVEFFESLRTRNAAIISVNEIPPEDVVFVVRCKDCFYMENGRCTNNYMNNNEASWLSVGLEWYCCHGVRRAD